MKVSDDGLLSKKIGIEVTAELLENDYGKYPQYVNIYRQGYLESTPSQEEIEAYYLEELRLDKEKGIF